MKTSKNFCREWLIVALVLGFCLLISCTSAETVILTRHPSMTDLYDTPDGNIIARIFYGIPVSILEETDGGWNRIAVGNEVTALEGWVVAGDLSEENSDSPIAQIVGSDAIPCSRKCIQVLSAPQTGAEVRKIWDADSEDRLAVTAITRDNNWLLTTLEQKGQSRLWGYIPADSVCSYSAGFVLASKANATVNLRETPSKKGKSIGSYYSGALVEFLFDFEEPQGWQRVSLGGISGYMMTRFIETDGADGIPYRSPLLALKGDSAPLYASASGTETVEDTPSLSRSDIFCILGKVEKRWHIRIQTDEIGVWKYGFVDTKSLENKKPACASVDAILTKTTQLLGLGEDYGPQCKKGKKVRISSFSVETPDQDSYFPLDYYQEGVNWVQITIFIKGDYGFDEPYFGYVPVDAVKFDKKLRLPATMGIR